MKEQPSSPDFDVALVGGGPAGAVAGRLLALWGHSVIVLTRPGSQSSLLGESLPPSTRKILERVGALEAVEAAGFVRSTGHTVWWGESHGRVEAFPERESGFQVLRSDLDRVLLALAKEAGARVEGDAAVRDVRIEGDIHRIEYTIGNTMAGDRTQTVRARWVLDCSGRSGVVARSYRRQQEGYATLALVGVWRRSGGWPVRDPTHTLVESFADGRVQVRRLRITEESDILEKPLKDLELPSGVLVGGVTRGESFHVPTRLFIINLYCRVVF